MHCTITQDIWSDALPDIQNVEARNAICFTKLQIGCIPKWWTEIEIELLIINIHRSFVMPNLQPILFYVWVSFQNVDQCVW